jgi:hypothetical protein
VTLAAITCYLIAVAVSLAPGLVVQPAGDAREDHGGRVERALHSRYDSNISSNAVFPAASSRRGGVRVGEVALSSAIGAGVEDTGAPAGREVDAAHRLATARGLLRRMEDRAAAARPVVEPGADGRMLPVVVPLAALLPGGGLRRGTTVAVSGATGAISLVLALLAEASATGAWAAVVGRPDLGLVAAAEAGIALERLALVPYPGADLVAVTAALLDGLDLVVVAGRVMHGGDRARLAARARQRGAVLLPLGPWPGADLELACEHGRWRGVDAEEGDLGRLTAREVRVQLRGRGVAPVGRTARLLLPGPTGGLAVGAEGVGGGLAADAEGVAVVDRSIGDREAG